MNYMLHTLSILQSIQKLQKISFALHLLKAITEVAGKDPLASLGVQPALSLFGAQYLLLL